MLTDLFTTPMMPSLTGITLPMSTSIASVPASMRSSFVITARVLRPTKRKTHSHECFVLIRVAKTHPSLSSSDSCMKCNAANQQRRAQDHVVSVHLESLINRSIRKHLAGSAPHKDLAKEKGLGTRQFEVIVITDYNRDFCTLHEVRGLTKHLWRTLRQAIHKCEWTEYISSIYVGPDNVNLFRTVFEIPLPTGEAAKRGNRLTPSIVDQIHS